MIGIIVCSATVYRCALCAVRCALCGDGVGGGGATKYYNKIYRISIYRYTK